MTPGQPRWVLSLEGSLHQLGARLQAIYPNKRIISLGTTSERETFTYPAPDAAPGTLHTRNQSAERAAIGRLISWGFHGPDTGGNYFLRGEDSVLRFFAMGLPDWQRDPAWQVTVGSRFQSVSKGIEVITPEVAVRGSGEDWFELELNLTGSSGERFSAHEIQRLLQMGGGHTRLRNGKLAILPAETLADFQEVLRDCDPTQSQPGVYRLRNTQAAYLQSSLEQWNIATAPSWQQWQARKGTLHRPEDLLLAEVLTRFLRPYQHEGVRWLHLLAETASAASSRTKWASAKLCKPSPTFPRKNLPLPPFLLLWSSAPPASWRTGVRKPRSSPPNSAPSPSTAPTAPPCSPKSQTATSSSPATPSCAATWKSTARATSPPSSWTKLTTSRIPTARSPWPPAPSAATIASSSRAPRWKTACATSGRSCTSPCPATSVTARISASVTNNRFPARAIPPPVPCATASRAASARSSCAAARKTWRRNSPTASSKPPSATSPPRRRRFTTPSSNKAA